MMREKVPLLISAATACGALLLLSYKRWKRRQFGGLDSIVSYSARVIAALRALETRKGQPRALVIDPLAEKLAGKVAMADVLRRYPSPADSYDGAGAPSINRLILRTLLIDYFVQLAVGSEISNQEENRALGSPMLKELSNWLSAKGRVCKQVVLLGAGMDTRAWRLSLPDGIQWWEVDVAEVLRAKRVIMESAGASFTDAAEVRGPQQGAMQLRCSSYTSVSADLQVPGWAACLVARGYDSHAPTAWVMEGLLYYLRPSTVPMLLKEAASVSGPGSCLAASIAGEGLVQRVQEKEKAGGSRIRPSITSAFKWGCPGDPKEYFAKHGWDVIDAPNWVEIAEDMGLNPELGDQKSSTDISTPQMLGEAPVASNDEATIKASRRARSAYLVARIKA